MVYPYFFFIYPPVDLRVSETLYPKHAPTDFALTRPFVPRRGGYFRDMADMSRTSWTD